MSYRNFTRTNKVVSKTRKLSKIWLLCYYYVNLIIEYFTKKLIPKCRNK